MTTITGPGDRAPPFRIVVRDHVRDHVAIGNLEVEAPSVEEARQLFSVALHELRGSKVVEDGISRLNDLRRIKRAMADRDMKQGDLAGLIGGDPSWLSKVLRGRTPLTTSKRRQLFEVLGITQEPAPTV